MNEERAAEGLDHLQAAAVEMKQAARAFLAVAEDLIAEHPKVAEVAAVFGSMADAATRAARGAAPGRSASDPADRGPVADQGRSADNDGDDGDDGDGQPTSEGT